MDFDLYKNNLEYPNANDYEKTYFYKDGKLIATRTPDGDTKLEDPNDKVDLTTISTRELVRDKQCYKEAREVYAAEDLRISELFKADLFEDLEIANNPRRHKLYALAYDQGHSSGYQEIYNVACNLVHLIEPLVINSQGFSDWYETVKLSEQEIRQIARVAYDAGLI